MDISIFLIIITLVIILIFAIYFLYAYKSTPVTITTSTTATGTSSSGAILVCPAGQCATSITNGSKICPQLEIQQLIIDPATSVCSSRFLCDNPRLPYAVNSDGSTNISGVCEPNVSCRCSATPSCSNEILATFEVTSGSPYQNFLGQRITITQNTISKTPTPPGVSSKINVYNPVALVNPLTDFCTISPSYLNYLSPGACSGINVSGATGIAQCMLADPCILGTLAYVPSNPNIFTSALAASTPMACVYGSKCTQPNTLAVWDNTNNSIKCVAIT